MRELVNAFHRGGGEGKPMFLQAMVGDDADEERAWQTAAQHWPVSVLKQEDIQNVPTPKPFAGATARVSMTHRKGRLRVSAALGRHLAWIQGDFALGVDRIFLYTVSGTPERFIDTFGQKILPVCGAAR